MMYLRRILRFMALLALGAALCSCSGTQTGDGETGAGIDSYVNVVSCGAVGDGQTDDTGAVRSAIKQAASTKSKTVFFPDGLYLITSSIEVPSGVSLTGITAATCGPWQNIMDGADKGVLYHNTALAGNFYNPDMYRGSWILASNGVGNADAGATFMLRGGNSVSLLGFVNASVTPMTEDESCTEAPPVIGVELESVTDKSGIVISDISLANCWYGIAVWQSGLTGTSDTSSLVSKSAGNISISNIMGSPMYCGVYLKGVADAVSLTNLQFNYAYYSGAYVAQRHSYARDVMVMACSDVKVDGMLSFGARTGIETLSAFGGEKVTLAAVNVNLEGMRPVVFGAYGEQSVANSYLLTVNFANSCADKDFSLITVKQDGGDARRSSYSFDNVVLQDSLISTDVTDLILDADVGGKASISITGATLWGYNPGLDEPIFRFIHSSGAASTLNVTNLSFASSITGWLAETGGDAYNNGEVTFSCCRIPEAVLGAIRLGDDSNIRFDACTSFGGGKTRRSITAAERRII